MKLDITSLERAVLSVAVTEYLKKHHSSEDEEVVAVAGILAERLRKGEAWDEAQRSGKRRRHSRTTEPSLSPIVVQPTATQLETLLALADRLSVTEKAGIKE